MQALAQSIQVFGGGGVCSALQRNRDVSQLGPPPKDRNWLIDG